MDKVKVFYQKYILNPHIWKVKGWNDRNKSLSGHMRIGIIFKFD